MRIKVDAYARPFQARGNLFDMRRFSCAVIALNHHAAVKSKASEDRQCGVGVKDIAVVCVWHPFVGD